MQVHFLLSLYIKEAIMKKIKEKDNSAKWWKELKELTERDKALNWCCKLFLESAFDVFVQREIGTNVALRFSLNYCPHCGTTLASVEPLVKSRGCCFLFRDLGLEGMQFEETILKDDDEADLTIHRLIINYCFHCGRKITRPSGEDECSWNDSGDCDNCGEC